MDKRVKSRVCRQSTGCGFTDKPTLREAAMVLLDELGGLADNEMVGAINPIAIENLRDALKKAQEGV